MQIIALKLDMVKGGGKRGHIVAHDVSWVGKRAGHKTFVADTKCF